MMQTVLFESKKYDGSINYRWQAQIEYVRDNLFILYTPTGTPFSGRRAGTFPQACRIYCWTDHWFNVEQFYLNDNGHSGIWHYVNLGTPVTVEGQTLSYVDLDLDLSMDNQWNVKLLDEDEFAAHRVRFNYPSHVVQRVRQAEQEVRKLMWQRAWPFATVTEGERVRIRPFFWSDLETIDGWAGAYGPFDDPWLIPASGTLERHDWFSSYLSTPVYRLYAIETCAQEMIGHISLREITLGSQARLGIGLAPLQTSKGYGTEALKTFLPYYFDVLGFERMVLDVAASNVRAIRSYERVGFRRYGEHYRGAGDEENWRVLSEPQYAALRPFFRKNAWGLQQLHYDMELTKAMWRTRSNGADAA